MKLSFVFLLSLTALTFGCAGNMQVAKTDMPEDDTAVAAAPVAAQPADRGIASVEEKEDDGIGRSPASDEDGGERVASGDNEQEAPAESRTYVRSHGFCNTLAAVKSILRKNGIEVPNHTGNAKSSGPAWIQNGYRVITPTEARGNNDICIYGGGRFGTIAIFTDHGWTDGCHRHSVDVPQWPGQHVIECFRAPARKAS